MALFAAGTTDILAARLRVSPLDRAVKIVIADWLIETAENINPRFDRRRFLKLAGLLDAASGPSYLSPTPDHNR